VKRAGIFSVVLLMTMITGASAQVSAETTTQPTTQPSDAEVVELQVGENIKITRGEIDRQLSILAANGRFVPRKAILDNVVQEALLSEYLQEQPEPTEELAALKEQMRSQLAAEGKDLDTVMAERGWTDQRLSQELKKQKVVSEVMAKEKIEAYIEAHPSYFDGTEVTASHILIMEDFYAPESEQTAAKEKLEGIIKDIKEGKTTFAEAAGKYSACPSSAQGGDLGAFTFDRMYPSFSEAAFDTKVGEMSGIVLTPFGYHVILVTDRKDGSGEPKLSAPSVASKVLQTKKTDEIKAAMIKKHPVTVNSRPESPQTQPADQE